MRILIVDQCSGSKDYPDSARLYDVEDIDQFGVETVREDSDITLPARDLYDGRQQQFIDEAVETLRAHDHHVDRKFLSAGFGLVNERERLPPYEATFREMDAETAMERAADFGVTEAISSLLADGEPYDVVFLSLGDDYLTPVDLEVILGSLPAETIAVLFNREEVATRFENVVSLSARTADAKAHGTITVALKGQYLKNFAMRVGDSTPTVADMVSLCTETDSSQAGFDNF